MNFEDYQNPSTPSNEKLPTEKKEQEQGDEEFEKTHFEAETKEKLPSGVEKGKEQITPKENTLEQEQTPKEIFLAIMHKRVQELLDEDRISEEYAKELLPRAGLIEFPDDFDNPRQYAENFLQVGAERIAEFNDGVKKIMESMGEIKDTIKLHRSRIEMLASADGQRYAEVIQRHLDFLNSLDTTLEETIKQLDSARHPPTPSNEKSPTEKKKEEAPSMVEEEVEEEPDRSYNEQTTVNGVEISVGWDSSYDNYAIYFPQIQIGKVASEKGVDDQVLRINRRPEVAKQIFDYASKLAQTESDVYKIYKQTNDFLAEVGN